jgi:hypothetical protein
MDDGLVLTDLLPGMVVKVVLDGSKLPALVAKELERGQRLGRHAGRPRGLESNVPSSRRPGHGQAPATIPRRGTCFAKQLFVRVEPAGPPGVPTGPRVMQSV